MRTTKNAHLAKVAGFGRRLPGAEVSWKSFTALAPSIFVYSSIFLRRARLTRLTSFFAAATFASALVSTTVILLAHAGSHGLDVEISRKLAGLNSHIFIRPVARGEAYCEVDRLVATLRQHERVVAVAPYALVDVVARVSNGNSRLLTVKGVEPRAEGKATEIMQYLKSGSLGALRPGESGTPVPLILGSVAAADLGLNVGGGLELVRGMLSAEAAPGSVVDVFHTGTDSDDLAYAHFLVVSDLAGLEPGCVHGVAVKTDSPFESATVAAQLAQLISNELEVEDWSARAMHVRAAIGALRWYLDAVILVIAGFAVAISAGVVLIVLHDKRREIGVLLAMGADVGQIRQTVASVGAIVGGVGVAGGGGMAYLLASVLTRHKLVPLPGSAWLVSHVPFVMLPEHFLYVAVAQLLIPVAVGRMLTADIPRRDLAGVLRDE